MNWTTKLFEDKVALDASYQWDGAKGGHSWKREVRDYMIGRCPPIQVLLDFGERADESPISIGAQGLIKDGLEHRFNLSGEDLATLSGHLWAFLQMSTKRGEAAKIVRAVRPERHGVEVWRALCWEINRGRGGLMVELRDRLQRPAPVKSYAAVSGAIADFDGLLEEYRAAGGTPIPDSELKQNFLKCLPGDLRENLIMKAAEDGETWSVFSRAVRTKVAFCLRCRDEPRGAYGLEESPAQHLAAAVGPAAACDHEDLPPEAQEELNAVFRRWGARPGQQRGQQTRPPPRATPSRQQEREPRCANCGKTGHSRAACPSPEVPPDKRPCFGCGKPGFRPGSCPTCKKTRHNQHLKAIEDAPRPIFCFQYEDVEGFMVPKKKVPMPKQYTLGEAISFSRNAFSVLGESQSSKRAKAKQSSGTVPDAKPERLFPGSTWDQSVTEPAHPRPIPWRPDRIIRRPGEATGGRALVLDFRVSPRPRLRRCWSLLLSPTERRRRHHPSILIPSAILER